jgi:prolyl oligopeptidase
VTDVLHGVPVPDPFRSLELDTEDTHRWVEAQNAHTLATLAPHQRAEREARLRELLSIDALGEAQLEGDTLLFYRRSGAEEQGAYFVAHAPDFTPVAHARCCAPRPSASAPPSTTPTSRPGGRYVAFGVSQNGDERSTLRVLDRARDPQRCSPTPSPHAKWSRLSWLGDDSGFYYTRYPAEHDADFPHDDPARVDTYGSRVYRHRLGEAPTADPLIFAASDPTALPERGRRPRTGST